MRFVSVVAIIFASILTFSANANEETDLTVANVAAQFYIDQKDWVAAQSEIDSALVLNPKDSRFLMLRSDLEFHRDHDSKRAYDSLKLALKNTKDRGLKYKILTRMAGIQDFRGKRKFAERLRDYAENFDDSKAGRSWSGWAGSLFGYDSNVLMASDTARKVLTSSDIASTFVNPLGGIRFSPRGESRFSGQPSFNYRHHQNSNVASFNTWVQSLDFAMKPIATLSGDSTLSLVNHSDLVYVRPNTFQFFNWTNVTQAMIQTKKSGYEMNYGAHFRYQRYSDRNITPGTQSRTGPGVRLVYQILFPVHSWKFGAGTYLDIQYNRGTDLRFQRYGGNASVGFQLAKDWSLDGNVVLQRTRYYHSSKRRVDSILSPEFGIKYAISSQWNSRLAYAFDRAYSNVSTAEYSKGSISFMLVCAL